MIKTAAATKGRTRPKTVMPPLRFSAHTLLRPAARQGTQETTPVAP
ncbi:hypothetical protein AcetOrient_orf04345 [Acetobacter orientalis]|uniref:Uncharacterized protein n=1 Tax=Acetobacter orientalis TaxID=146474 RepID=A0A2Z5ZKR1_9PROT|nr:hypothetical protein AcetOrient_orf04345 [Acetobacter orientalis]